MSAAVLAEHFVMATCAATVVLFEQSLASTEGTTGLDVLLELSSVLGGK